MSKDIPIEERLRFFGIDENVKQDIRSMRGVFEKKLPGALDAFYAHVKQWPHLAQLFRSSSHMSEAKKKQYDHWMNNIMSGDLGDDYTVSVKAIGKAHHRLNLEPFWYIGGYAKLTNELFDVISEDMKDSFWQNNASKRTAALKAIMSAVLYDISYSISVYLEEGEKDRDSILTSIASSVEETSSNVNTIAASIEELTRSADEVSERVVDVAMRSSESNSAVSDTVKTVRNLETAAMEINNVVQMIEDIAEQTNLLALNATIEAARSGDAGKGFAVVANEVKSLASETSNAIGGISEKVNMIRDVTNQTVHAINQIAESIRSVDSQTDGMKSDIEQQRAALQEIAKNTEEAAQGAREVAESVQSMKKPDGNKDAKLNQAANQSSSYNKEAAE